MTTGSSTASDITRNAVKPMLDELARWTDALMSPFARPPREAADWPDPRDVPQRTSL